MIPDNIYYALWFLVFLLNTVNVVMMMRLWWSTNKYIKAKNEETEIQRKANKNAIHRINMIDNYYNRIMEMGDEAIRRGKENKEENSSNADKKC